MSKTERFISDGKLDSTNSSERGRLEFDYVIVGAGPSAMGLLLGLLEPYKDATSLPFTVAVLERGSDDPLAEDNPIVVSPSRWFEASHNPSSPHVTLIQHTSRLASGRRMDVPIGSGIGGGSNINATLCLEPSVEDFDDWPAPWNDRKIMRHHLKCVRDILCENGCLLDALTGDHVNTKKSSENVVPCLSRRNQCRGGRIERENYFRALLEPLLKECPHLESRVKWFCGVEAQRLLFQGRQVLGVETKTLLVDDDELRGYINVWAKEEVILCAGAIETPALLLISGIGLESGIPGVGQNLRDHIILPRVLLSPPSTQSVNGVHELRSFAVDDNNYLLLTSTTVPEIAFHFFSRIIENVCCRETCGNSVTNLLWKILEPILYGTVMYTPIYYIMKYCLTTMNLSLLNPRSAGSIHVQPKSKKTRSESIRRRLDFHIYLDHGYLENRQDIQALCKGWVAGPALCPRQTAEIFPGLIVRSICNCYNYFVNDNDTGLCMNWIALFSRVACLPFFHWCGTCRIKSAHEQDEDENWVVDCDLKVRTYQNLRICDASVFLSNLSAPPALSCAVLGHIIGSQISKKAKSE